MKKLILLISVLCVAGIWAQETRNFYITELVVAKKKARGKHWDSFRGKPDIRVTIKVLRRNGWQKVFVSPVEKNQFHLVRPLNTGVNVSIDESILVIVEDKDVAQHDKIGSYTLQLSNVDSENESKVSFGFVNSFRYVFSRYSSLAERKKQLELLGKKPKKQPKKEQPKKRKIQLKVVSDFPKGKSLTPKTANIAGKDVRETAFFPGTYTLEIKHPGYMPLKKKINLTSGTGPLKIDAKLISAPRTVYITVKHDVAPPANLVSHILYLGSAYDKESRVIKSGEKIKPGSHLFRVEQIGYRAGMDNYSRKKVDPDTKPLNITLKLIANKRKINPATKYSMMVFKSSKKPIIALIGSSGVARVVKKDKWIKPGTYSLFMYQQGYNFLGPKTITIPPGNPDKVFTFTGNLDKGSPDDVVVDKRRLVFYMEHSGTMVLAKIINRTTKKEVTFKEYFPINSKVKLRFEALDYFPMDAGADVTILPGEGPQVVEYTRDPYGSDN